MFMGRWERVGWHRYPIFKDRKRLLKRDIENWTGMEGKLTSNARKALEALPLFTTVISR